MSALTPACILADAPQFVTPGQRAPVLDLFDAAPPILKVLTVKDGDPPVLINIPVRSEDAGEQLFGVLWLDYGTLQSQLEGVSRVSASTYDDSTRTVGHPWPADGLSSGCHRLSLLVAHESSFDGNLQVIPARKSDVAIATWLVAANEQPGVPINFDDCPEPAL
ncbi:MAG TPA: hypothetical protein VGI10_30975 [Polyangiaceae bacterium]